MKKNNEEKPKAEDVLPKVADTISEKAETITVDVKPKNRFERLLIKLKIKPSKRLFEIRPQRVINIYRMSGREKVLEVAVSNYNTTSFINSIALIVGVDALNLKASPETTTGV
jgi:hypothetical protein